MLTRIRRWLARLIDPDPGDRELDAAALRGALALARERAQLERIGRAVAIMAQVTGQLSRKMLSAAWASQTDEQHAAFIAFVLEWYERPDPAFGGRSPETVYEAARQLILDTFFKE